MAWHEDCFVCAGCAGSLANVVFVVNADNQLSCHKCYDEQHAVPCPTCDELVKLGHEKFKLGELVWHRKCFQCHNCHDSLQPHSFWMHEQHNYCKNCYGDLYTDTCGRCKEVRA